MKAILSYKNYQSFGKQYQVKFVYENEVEVKKTSELIRTLKKEYLINPRCRKFKNNNIVDKTNIPKNDILSFINKLFSLKNIIKSKNYIEILKMKNLLILSLMQLKKILINYI